MSKVQYRWVMSVLLAVWFAFAVLGSANHVFQGKPSQPPVALALAAALPVLVFLVWFQVSASFRQFVQSLDARTLVYVQSWRILGFDFVVLYSLGLLPGYFALPAGLGDVAIGLTAPIVAARWLRPESKPLYIAWQLLGITDLVLALAFGATAGFVAPHGLTTTMMTLLPSSLIPTFGVPLFLILHLICLMQIREWKTTKLAVAQ